MREQSPQAGRLLTAARTVCRALTRGQRGRVPRSRYIVRWRVDPVTAAKARHSDQAARWISSPCRPRSTRATARAPSRMRRWKTPAFRLRSRPSGHPSAPHTRMTQTRNTSGPIAGECRCSAATVTSSVAGWIPPWLVFCPDFGPGFFYGGVIPSMGQPDAFTGRPVTPW